jgi:hypothetical protein
MYIYLCITLCIHALHTHHIIHFFLIFQSQVFKQVGNTSHIIAVMISNVPVPITQHNKIDDFLDGVALCVKLESQFIGCDIYNESSKDDKRTKVHINMNDDNKYEAKDENSQAQSWNIVCKTKESKYSKK